ncbi:MAG TPA: zinc-binding dehydrogenase [Candidatus Marinimicrobia bacterium]|jgi:NADPH:quinone reductase-like Zn-dependent oxidoreductase|nr:zinc-binding dehydrogenase [Candidatus Neomarinimicrobiota bacterium]MDP7217617.1 zinc-binding dehydrogenase [Candidatus Neomarinimicrobiota bacterium]HBN45511.1 alcohol dehydrogenase [Candidatus Neomarinimicrobiota bacterium]HJL73971.1 zinc-binding dehydrogenase [Candidatus Neomarinimicrobiota bacterium]HJM70409.1 zinc-binding dehydrogenase [Candidatus Neomarinimicrobiota bacterium]|tara:strand:- start:1016 stop:2071 length:1056 start_codon:yes stop_codon:yes gene_type:complete
MNNSAVNFAMQQVVITRHGGPEVLHVRETAETQLKSGDVLVDVKYSGINFADILMRMGLYPTAPKPPFTPGYEVSGVISKVGSTENNDLIGKSVAALTPFGGYASKVAVKKERLITLPEDFDLAQAAAMPVVYLTSYVMLFLQAHLQKDEWVLIHNIGGGVGLAATELSRTIGANIIGTASAGKHDRLREKGLHNLIDYNTEDFVARVNDITEGQGVDVIIDPIGGDNLKKSYKALGTFGRLVAFGFSTAANSPRRKILHLFKEYIKTPKFSPIKQLMIHNKGVFGCHLGMVMDRQDLLQKCMEKLMSYLQNGDINPHVDRIFPLSKVQDAHQYIMDRRNFGKVLLAADEQ